MRVGEILRQLADRIDQIEQPQGQSTGVATHSGEDHEHINTKSMVPPLQQKLELLKKGVGLDNAFDNGEIQLDTEACDGCGCSPCECDTGHNGLETLKRNAGIAPVVIQIASDDEPLDM